MATTQKSRSGAAIEDNVFSAAEKAALRETARERKAQAKSKDLRADGERDVLAKIEELAGSDKAMAGRLHELIMAAVPALAARTWYGMPAYTLDGKLICFYKAASKFNSRYATFGFEDAARLDDGTMWPTSYALTELTKDHEAKIVALVKKAAR
jgi:uncharacterized protein YdhG (YjbR/CyaY superfamily)